MFRLTFLLATIVASPKLTCARTRCNPCKMSGTWTSSSSSSKQCMHFVGMKVGKVSRSSSSCSRWDNQIRRSMRSLEWQWDTPKGLNGLQLVVAIITKVDSSKPLFPNAPCKPFETQEFDSRADVSTKFEDQCSHSNGNGILRKV